MALGVRMLETLMVRRANWRGVPTAQQMCHLEFRLARTP